MSRLVYRRKSQDRIAQGIRILPCFTMSALSSNTLLSPLSLQLLLSSGCPVAIYTQDVNQAFYAMQELDTGICYVNAATIWSA